MTDIRKFEIGSDDDDITHNTIKSSPKAKAVPKGFKEYSQKEDEERAKKEFGGGKGVFDAAHKSGYKVHVHPDKEVVYFSKDPTYKDQNKNKGGKK